MTEIELYNEIRKKWAGCYPNDHGMGDEDAIIGIEQFDHICRHFYELGRLSK